MVAITETGEHPIRESSAGEPNPHLEQWGDKYLHDSGSGPLQVVEDSTGSPVRVRIRSDVELDELRIRLTP